MAGFGKGFLRALKINGNLIGDVVPVDFPINLMIAAAWNRAMEETYFKNSFSFVYYILSPSFILCADLKK